VPNEEPPRSADLDEVRSRLNEGLKTCRAMISDYRALLTSEGESGTVAESGEPERPSLPEDSAPA
jgi:hypothetical protein